MSNNAYTVLALLEAKPEYEEKLKKMLQDIVEPSRSEDTCVNYHLYQDRNVPTKIFLI